MALITYTHVYKLVDKMVAAYIALKGTSGSGLGAGSAGAWGASEVGDDIKELIEASADATFADADLQIPLGSPAYALKLNFDVDTLYSVAMSGFLNTLSNVAVGVRATVDESITDLEKFLYWYNWLDGYEDVSHTPSKYWRCMAPPEWYYAYYAMRQVRPSKYNLYYPVTLAIYAGVAALKVVYTTGTPAYTPGTAVDHTKYAGGVPYIVWDTVTASGAASITLKAEDQDGNLDTWTVTPGTWGAGNFTTPSRAGLKLTAVTQPFSLMTDATAHTDWAITNVTTGNFYIEIRPPATRTYPPT